MEIVKNETSGKFRVLLGGHLLNDCKVDGDCPGRALCAKNSTWSEFPTMCTCRLMAGHTGATCDEVSSLGNTISGVYAIVMIIAGLGVLWAGLNVFRLVRARQSKKDALFSSTALLFIASLSLLIFGGFMCSQPHRKLAIVNEQGSKKIDLAWQTALLSATLFCSTLACLNITLVWVQIADNVRRMKTKSASNLARPYQIALFIFYVFVLGGIIATMRSENASRGAAAVAAFSMGFVLLGYIVGFIKMKFMLTSLVSSSGSDQQPSNVNSSASSRENLRMALRKIRIVSFVAGTLTLIMLILSALYTVNRAEDTAPDALLTSALENAFAWICIGLILHVNIWYISDTVSKKYATYLAGPASGTSKDDAHQDTKRSTKRIEGESSTNPHVVVSSQVGSIVPSTM